MLKLVLDAASRRQSGYAASPRTVRAGTGAQRANRSGTPPPLRSAAICLAPRYGSPPALPAPHAPVSTNLTAESDPGHQLVVLLAP